VADEKTIVFGSDLGVHDPRYTLSGIGLADISEQAKRKILGENMARILKDCQVELGGRKKLC
jgi:predicted TIM-barrel fold metal-dependent hydrolase